jgi:hypothetical protein
MIMVLDVSPGIEIYKVIDNQLAFLHRINLNN